MAFYFDHAGHRAHNLAAGTYTPQFLVGQNPRGDDLYEPSILLQPDQSAVVWIPFDPALGLEKLRSLAASKGAGTWHYRCVWFDTRRAYEEKV
jgi:hypothetical protein